MLHDLSEHPTASVPAATETVSDSQSMYRFWSNPAVKAESILASHRDGVLARCRPQSVVLAIQDTTDLNFTSHPATQGLGFINQSPQQGIKVHSCLAVSGAGEPLGVLHQTHWSRAERTGQKQKRRQTRIEEKESYRWLTTQKAAETDMPASVQLIHVGDREADIFELLAQPRAAGSELLIRAGQHRTVQHELRYLPRALEQAPLVGEQTIHLARHPQRAAREAHLQIRAMQITLEVPVNHLNRQSLSPITLNAILVEEPIAPNDDTPIHWILLTTLPLSTFAEVWQCVVWYSYRWLIERFHFTLKSGCRIEALQLHHCDRLIKALWRGLSRFHDLLEGAQLADKT
jgi:hypothetical protein